LKTRLIPEKMSNSSVCIDGVGVDGVGIDGSSVDEVIADVNDSDETFPLEQVVKEAISRSKLAEQRTRYLRNKLVHAEKEKEDAITSMISLETRLGMATETVISKIQPYCCGQVEFFGVDLMKRSDEVMIEKAKVVASLEEGVDRLRKEMEVIQNEAYESKDTVKDCKIYELEAQLLDSQNEVKEIKQGYKINPNLYEIKKELEDSQSTVEDLKKSLKLSLKFDGLKIELEESRNQVEKYETMIKNLQEELKDENEARQNAEIVAAELITKLESEITKKLGKLEEVKNKELRALEIKMKDTDSKFHEHRKILSAKDELLKKYETERSTLSTIAKIGVVHVGEQAKHTASYFSNKSRSLSRFFDRRGRSRSRSVARSRRSRSTREKEVSIECIKPTNPIKRSQVETRQDNPPEKTKSTEIRTDDRVERHIKKEKEVRKKSEENPMQTRQVNEKENLGVSADVE